MNAKIINIATANPRPRLSQEETFEMLLREKNLSRREKALYKRFLSDKGIGYRYFAVETTKDFFMKDQDLIIRRFQEQAAHLSVVAIERCLKESGVSKDEIGCLAVSTCTGYLCPGLTSYVIEKAKLRPDIFTLDIAGMGCGGAMPAVQACHNYLNSNKDTYALAVSTEICSSALFWGDDPELILSNSIFSDGSAACLLTNRAGRSGFKILGFTSKIAPHHRDTLRFRTENSRLRNVIKEAVPGIAAELIKEIAGNLLKEHGLKQGDIKFWALHPGGRKVLDMVQKKMDLKADDLAYSRRVLYNYGNMSSPTVLYVLKEIFKDNAPGKRAAAFMASFGAGFSGYAGLLRYE